MTPKSTLLTSCSVFAGGFDIAGACAVAGSEDEFVILDLLDSLTRKSLLAADKSSGRTRFSMLETIRQYAEEQLVANGEADVARTAHARYFADAKPHVMALWDGPRQRERTIGSPSSCRTSVPPSAGHPTTATSTLPPLSRSTRTFLGFWVEQHEPVAWAEELIEPAQNVEHRRLAQIYAMAAQCYCNRAVRRLRRVQQRRPCGRRQRAIRRSRRRFLRHAPRRLPAQRSRGLCRTVSATRKAQGLDNPIVHRQTLVFALTIIGATDEAIAACGKLTRRGPTRPRIPICGPPPSSPTASPTATPTLLQPYEVHQRGLAIAQESGNQTDRIGARTKPGAAGGLHADPI